MKHRILVVDDSKVFRHVEEKLLSAGGYEFLHAANGIEAIEMAVRHKPDLVLLDIQMPVMDGVKALSILKSKESTRNIPVLIVSSDASEKERATLLSLGAADCIAKPLEAHSLLESVTRTLLLR